ncbi:hypothetical protein Trydic_g2575 [Trypoxylus dichotomus]
MKNILCCIFNVFVLITASGKVNHHYYWRDYWGEIPHDAISYAGIYVAQIPNHGILPASLYPQTKEAVTEVFGRKVVETKSIKVLCDPNSENFYWEYTTTDKLTEDKLENLVVGGVESGSYLYIGKIFNEGEWKICKVFPPSSEYKGLRGWNRNNTQLFSDDFQVLKYKAHPTTPRLLIAATGKGNHHYYWRDYWGEIPHDAISYAGIYVAQIPNNGILPAGLYPETKEAITEVFEHKVVETKSIKVLCDPNSENFYWEYTTRDKLTDENLDNLVVGGIEAGSYLYIGKIFHEGEWKICKVFPKSSGIRGLRGWYRNNSHFVADDFQILKYKAHPVTPRC